MKFLDKLKNKFKKAETSDEYEEYEDEYEEEEGLEASENDGNSSEELEEFFDHQDDELVTFEEEEDEEEAFEPSDEGTADIDVEKLKAEMQELEESEEDIEEALLAADNPDSDDLDAALEALKSDDSEIEEDLSFSDDEEEDLEEELDEIPSIESVLQTANTAVENEIEDELEENDEEIHFDEDEDYDYEESHSAPSFFARVKDKFSRKKDDSYEEELHEEEEIERGPGLLEKAKAKFSQSEPKPAQTDTPSILSLGPEEMFKALYSEQARPFIHKSFITGSILITSYLGGSLVSEFVEKKATPKKRKSVIANNVKRVNWNSEVAKVKNTNPFNLKLNENNIPKRDKSPVVDENLVCEKADKESAIPVRLVSTIVLQDSVKSIASVQHRGKNLSIREGEKVNNLAEVGRITQDKLIFKNLKSGQCEYVQMKKAKRPTKKIAWMNPKKGAPLLEQNKNKDIKQVGNNITIKKAFRDKALQNIGEILTQAKAVMIKNPDGTLSFKMTEIVPGGFFAGFNIQDGDIVNSINGKKYTNMNELMALFGQLKNNDEYEINLTRDGVEQNYNVKFE